MVWGGIIGGQKTRFIVIRGNLNAQRYIDEVLNAEAIPFMQRKLSYSQRQHHAMSSNVSSYEPYRAYLGCAWQKCSAKSQPTKHPRADKCVDSRTEQPSE